MAKLFVEIGARVGEFQKALNRIERQVNQFSRKMERLGTNLTQSISLPLAGLGAASVGAFAQFERLEKGLIAITGDADKAAQEMERLKQSAQLPGLGFEEAVKGSIRLQAVGLSADEARRTLEVFGTAIAATGGNAKNLDSVQYQLTQMISKNRILQEDFGILQENVPLLGKALEIAFGTSNLEQIRATGISAQEFNSRIVTALGGLEELKGVTGGVGNAFDNFRDSLRFSLVELGRTISESINLSGILNRLSNFIANVVAGFKSLNPETQKFIIIAAGVVAAIGPVLLIASKLSSVIPLLILGFKNIASAVGLVSKAFAFLLANPIVAVIIAIGAAVAYAYTQFENVRKVVNGVIDVILELGNIAGDVVSNLAKGFAALADFRFEDAFESFNKALTNINPLAGLAEGGGGRLGKAFSKGFEDGTNRIEDGIKKLKRTISSQTGGLQPSGPGVDTSILDPSGIGSTGTGAGSGEKVAQDFVLPVNDAIRKLIRENPLPRLFTDTEAAAQGFFEASNKLADINIKPSVLAEINKALNDIDVRARIIGEDSFSALGEKVNFLKDRMAELAVTWGENSVQVLALRETLAPLEEEFNKIARQKEIFEGITGIISDLTAGFDGFFETLFSGGKNAFKSISDSLKKLLVELTKAVAVSAVLALIFSALGGGSFLSLFKTIGIGQGGGLGNILKLIPGFAEGGIVPPGYPNDSYLARLSSGEAVVPLSKLNQFAGGPVNVTGEFRIVGNDLVAVVDRNVQNRERTRGR